MRRKELFHLVSTFCEMQELLLERSGQTKACEHFRRAKKECLLGFRAMLNKVIDDLDEESGEISEAYEAKGKKITIND